MTIDQMIDDIIRREGGYVNHPADRGGPTKYGITQKTLSDWFGVPASETSVRTMSEALARQIYRENYYLAPKIDQLPPAIQPFLFDCAVNHGPSSAVKFLQNVLRLLGHTVAIDGKIGPQTCNAAIEAVAKHGERRVLKRLIEHRRTFYLAIVDRDPSQKVFLKGWMNRLAEFDPQEEEPDQLAAAEARSVDAADENAALKARIAELEAALADERERHRAQYDFAKMGQPHTPEPDTQL